MAQAQLEQMVLRTTDRMFDKYSVEVFWLGNKLGTTLAEIRIFLLGFSRSFSVTS